MNSFLILPKHIIKQYKPQKFIINYGSLIKSIDGRLQITYKCPYCDNVMKPIGTFKFCCVVCKNIFKLKMCDFIQKMSTDIYVECLGKEISENKP